MSDDIIKRLREAIAAGPTPGPWVAWADTNLIICLHSGADRSEDLRICEVSTNTRKDEGRKNRDYIAAASPDNIAAVLDRLDAAEAENERLRAERDEHARWRVDLADKLHDAESQISAAWAALRRAGIQSEETVAEAIALLHAENDRLREDADRYRWLRGSADIPAHSTRWARWEVRRWDGRYWSTIFTEQVDAAIDAAMAKDQK